MSVPWRIHYGDGSVVEGRTASEWRAAPDDGVQVVVLLRPPVVDAGEARWAHVTDRLLWTGDDTYSIFGWPVKYGTLLPDEDYYAIWEEAKTCPY